MSNIDRYNDALNQIPAPGGGCHTALLSVANIGILAGRSPERLFDDMRQVIPEGSRRISDREIQDAINKAMADHNNGTFTPKSKPVPVVNDGKTALQRIIRQGKYCDDADLWETSPIRLLEEPITDPGLLLENLYTPDDLLFIGDTYDEGKIGTTIQPAHEWSEYFRAGGKTAPHIIINPLNGVSMPKESGDGETYRGNRNVKAFRYCLVEFDNLSREDQIRFWSAVKLPIVALTDSGGKSIHAWLEVSKLATVTTPEQWATEIKNRLYDRLLIPMGVDSACSNPARLSRLPGHYREEKGNHQRLLWVSPEGRII
jgi:hypothetical protein